MLATDETRPPGRLAGLTQLVRSIAARQDRWADLVRYHAGERWYQRLEQTGNHELWLLSWLPGQRTGFHDHFGSAGAFAVVRGEVQERTIPAGCALPGGAVLRRAAAQRAAVRGAPAGAAFHVRKAEAATDARVAVAAFAAGQVRAFGPEHVHEVVNGSAQPAVSIHAYSPSLAGMRRYQLTPAGLVLAAVDMAGERW